MLGPRCRRRGAQGPLAHKQRRFVKKRLAMLLSSVALTGLAVPILLGLLLTVSGVSKFLTLSSFLETVTQYRLLPIQFVKAVGLGIPAAEVLVGTMLLSGYMVTRCCTIAAILFGTFALAISINLIRGRRNISCGCFGANTSPISWFLAARNVFLAVLSAMLATFYARFSISATLDRPSTSLIVLACIVTVVLTRALDHMSRPVDGNMSERN